MNQNTIINNGLKGEGIGMENFDEQKKKSKSACLIRMCRLLTERIVYNYYYKIEKANVLCWSEMQ